MDGGEAGDGDAADGGDGDVKGDAAMDAANDASPSCPPCSGSMPACNEATLSCVVCTAENSGACTDSAHCKVADDASLNSCVECTENAHCTNPAKSVCDTSSHQCKPCQGASDCSHQAATPVCRTSDKLCVACLPGAGNRTKCGDKVCDMVSESVPTCADTETPRSADACAPCVSDEQCKVGQVCVKMGWDSDDNDSKETDVGWFCQWKQGTDQGAKADCTLAAARPYYDDGSLPSADEPTTAHPICTLRVSTCPAHAAHSSPCGRAEVGNDSYLVNSKSSDLNGNPIVPSLDVSSIHPDDSVCGLGGKCVAKNATNGAYLCSVRCLGTNGVDCPDGVTCGGAPPSTPGICGI